eukprot:EG_transcript_17642
MPRHPVLGSMRYGAVRPPVHTDRVPWSESTRPLQAPPEAEAVREAVQFLQQRYPGRPLAHFTDDFLRLMLRKYGAGAPGRLAQIMDWRIRSKADSLPRTQPRLPPDVMFWHGRDKHQRPVLYLRPGRFDMLSYDADKTFYTLLTLLEEGIEALSPGVADLILVIDTSGIGLLHFNPAFIRPIVSLAVEGYANRIFRVIVGPTNPLINSIWGFIDGLLPADFRNKVLLTNLPAKIIAQQVDSLPPWPMF